jgi:hypothetical protein
MGLRNLIPAGMNAQDSANHILVDFDAESQGDLLGNAGGLAGPLGMSLI